MMNVHPEGLGEAMAWNVADWGSITACSNYAVSNQALFCL